MHDFGCLSFRNFLFHSCFTFIDDLIGPFVTHASQVRSPAHLKSKISQYPMLAAAITSIAWDIGSSPMPLWMQSMMSGVWMNAAQFRHHAFLACSTGI